MEFSLYHQFSYHPLIAASEGQILTTQEHQHRCPILLEFRHSSPPICTNHKKPEVDKKIRACEILTLTMSFVFSLCRCSKQSVSRLSTLNWSEHFIQLGFSQIWSGNNNCWNIIVIVCLWSHSFDKQGCDFTYVQEYF